MKLTKKLLLVLVAVVTVCVVASCRPKPEEKETYTYKSWTTALGSNWNPHAWETNADDAILSYISSPFVTMSIKDSKEGVYQWVYEMATDVVDTTKENQADLEKYGSKLPEGKSAADVESGYVFDIKLNQEAKWENGDVINADSYVESMKRLLDPKMKNYRANLYYAGESAIAGALEYYNSESPIFEPVVPAYGEGETPDYSYDVENNDVYINFSTESMTLAGYSFKTIQSQYLGGAEGARLGELIEKLSLQANAYGYVPVTADNKADVTEAMNLYLVPFGLNSADGSVAPGTYVPAKGENPGPGEFKPGSAAGGTQWTVFAGGSSTTEFVTDGEITVSVDGSGVYTIVLECGVTNAKFVGKLQ